MTLRDRIKLIQKERAQTGKVLVWIGVSVWVPYVVLLLGGRTPPLIVFLPIHLLFVLTGLAIKRRSDSEQTEAASQNWMRRASRVMLMIGLTAWLPYFYIHYYRNVDVEISPFLVVHLFGMIGGVVLRVI